MRAETFHPAELDLADALAWRGLCAADPAFANPLFSPEFAQAVGRVRHDARVTLWREDGQVVGVLAHHLRPGALARPIAGPLSDYHGLVSAGRLDVAQALAVAGLKAYPFTSLLDPHGGFAGHVGGRREGFVIQLDGTAEAYLEALRAASPKRFKNYRRLDHKLERELGEVVLTAPDRSVAVFDRLLDWKRGQLARTGARDFLRPDWTRRLLRELFEEREGPLQPLMISLHVGGRLVAGHFGIRLGGVYHPWIASTDPEMAAWSPGQLFLLRAIAAMPELGLSTYDLGPGHEHYKRPYALSTRSVGEGRVAAAGAAGRAARASDRAWSLVGGAHGGPLHRLRRNLDAIAGVELSLAGRTRGLAAAVAARALRTRRAEQP